MRIFITGATGAVGSPVCKALADRGHDIVALVRNLESERRVSNLGYEPVVGDMALPSSWQDMAEVCDALIHAAWVRPGRRMGMSWVRHAMQADAIAVDALIETAKRSSRCQSLLLTSGHSVYGDHGDDWIDEKTVLRPGAVGKKQLACEKRGMEAAKKGVPCFVIRPCTVYGPLGPAVDFFFDSAAKGKIHYPGNGENFFPFIRDTDLAEAYALAIEKRPIGEVISVGDNQPLRLQEVAEVVLEQFGDGKSGPVPRWLVAIMAGGPLAEMLTHSFRVRNDKAKELLGWKPEFPTLRDGIAGAVEAWRREKAKRTGNASSDRVAYPTSNT